MTVQLRRYVAGAVVAGALSAAAVFAVPTGTAGWEPVTYGLTAAPEQLLPAEVSAEKPATVVTTTLDPDGRPVVAVRTATDRTAAAELIKDGQSAERAVGVELDAPAYALEVPAGSDPYQAIQWDLPNIRTAQAWTRSSGAGVTVAVVDSGVDADHPDLAANVLPGLDLITGSTGRGIDPHGHGTHVAGTIAAVTGNDTGISGVAPHAKILPVRVLAADGVGSMGVAAQGIVWAADNGAQVINLSMGATAQVAAVTNAIGYARSKGVVVVAAVGNSRMAGSPTNFPAADEGVIGVAATDPAGTYAGYSNAGGYVDLAAPGSGIVSTYPTALGHPYVGMNGTSMAAPHVAAVAALLKSYDAGLTPDQVEAALTRSAADRGPAGRDDDYGYGLLDAVAALDVVTPAPAVPAAPVEAAVPAADPAPVPAGSVPAESVLFGTAGSAPVEPAGSAAPTATATATATPAPTAEASASPAGDGSGAPSAGPPAGGPVS